MKKRYLIIISISLLIIVGIGLLIFLNKSKDSVVEEEVIEEKRPEKYGIFLDEWDVYIDTVKKGEYLGTIMSRYGITAQQIDKISKMSSDTFNVTMINVGHPFIIFSDTIINNVPIAKVFVYENSRTLYTRYDFRNNDTIIIEKLRKKVDTVTNSASGIIKHSLWETMVGNGHSWGLALALSQTFAWTVDFYSLQPGDWFKVIYDELYVEDEKVGLGEIKSGVFYHGNKELWAIPFTQDSLKCFFDTLGNSMRKTFLKAPLEYTRVSSRYSNARMHPIFNRVREHLAVDFAAPMGTPIFAASDGTIVARTYGTGAGNYVTIRHNSVYTTVYMHLSRFGQQNVGQYVSQGSIIGYVGSTGWSTGPHLHYEIHENGHKIDPLTFEPPPAEPVDSTNMERFNIEKRNWIDLVNKIELEINSK